jgi:hypothetical protein
MFGLTKWPHEKFSKPLATLSFADGGRLRWIGSRSSCHSANMWQKNDPLASGSNVSPFVHRGYFLGLFGNTWDKGHPTILPMKKQVRARGRKWEYFSRSHCERDSCSADKAGGQKRSPDHFLPRGDELGRLIRCEFSWVEPLKRRGPNLFDNWGVPRRPEHPILRVTDPSFDTLLTPNLSTFSSAVVPGTARIGRESDRDFPDVQI